MHFYLSCCNVYFYFLFFKKNWILTLFQFLFVCCGCTEMEALYIRLSVRSPAVWLWLRLFSDFWRPRPDGVSCASPECAVTAAQYHLIAERTSGLFASRADRRLRGGSVCQRFYLGLTPVTPRSVSPARAYPVERSAAIWCAPPATPCLTKLRYWPCHSSASATI